MKSEEILKLINKCSTLNENYQIKYIDPTDYSKLANMLEEAIDTNNQRELLKTTRERNAFNDGYSLGCKTTRKKYEQ
tara:strand:+ start:1333 stop:1563 length:231 start_codon:yes stop_codon:yes gene_type:complete